MNVKLTHTLGPKHFIPVGKGLEAFHSEIISEVADKMASITAQKKGVPTTFGDDKLPIKKRDGDAVVLDAPMVAYVNHGRLLVDCAVCYSGVHVDAVDEVAPCFLCGTTWRGRHIAFPPDLEAVDRALGARRTDQRNFDPRRGDTLASLTAQANPKVVP